MKKAPAPERARHYRHENFNTADGFVERISSIRCSLLEAGIEPANPDALYAYLAQSQTSPFRFATASKPRKRNGWLIAHFDRGLPFVVTAGDWSTGAETKWVAGAWNTLSLAEQQLLRQRLSESRRRRKEEQVRQWDARATAVARHWQRLSPANQGHPYLQSKGIQPHRARQQGPEIVLLITDFSGKAWSLQRINEAGDKRLMAGGKKSGNFIVVDGPENPNRVLVCEGWATGCTLAESDPTALVLAAIDCGNLKSVATGARKYWPSIELIVCGDDDRQTPGNPGATAARTAALAAEAMLALPEWPTEAPPGLTDFNDLALWQRGRL